MIPAIELKDVSFAYEQENVLQNASLKVMPGAF